MLKQERDQDDDTPNAAAAAAATDPKPPLAAAHSTANGGESSVRENKNNVTLLESSVVARNTDEKLLSANRGPAGHMEEEEEEGNIAATTTTTNTGMKKEESSETMGSYKSKHMTSVAGTANEATSERRKDKPPTYSHPVFGTPLEVETSGNFPTVGSTLGHYFCLGRLGKGTFSSIHRCVNMSFFHQNDTTKRRLAAAKVELSTFQQSGVLEAEATILAFLHDSLQPGTVPVYMGHYRSGDYAAILMEYLPGEDMHHLREKVIAGTMSRRMSVKDAVYLTADVMLPLLQRMHEVGILHRDVKPSNLVRSGGPLNKDFCIVDFGLSKSVVVPSDSPWADLDHSWNGDTWLKPQGYSGKGSFRNEREKADFRGTSMYASLRVHQLKDYCPRDDMWSLLYVFCDLVSGGLPWMSHAANRDREMCHKLKEKVLGDANGNDDMDQLLMGDAYHVTLFKRAKQEDSGEKERLSTVPDPLAMHKDQVKVAALRKAFKHLAGLQFWEKPDYELIRDCIHEFLKDYVDDPLVNPVDWTGRPESPTVNPLSPFKRNASGGTIPGWHIETDLDPLQDDAFEEAEADLKAEPPEPPTESSDKAYMIRLPVILRFKVQQMEYNEKNREDIAPHLALRDWMSVAIPLLYEKWDSRKFEGGHRTSTDGYRRENYLDLLKTCQQSAGAFKDKFRSQESFYHYETNGASGGDISSLDHDAASAPPTKKRKQRRIVSDAASASSSSNFATLSRVLVGLRFAIKAELTKKSPPPMSISFGF